MQTVMYDILYRTERDHWWYRARRNLIMKMLAKIQQRRSIPMRMLDVGCGTGLLMKEMSRYGRVDGVDISEHAIGFCKKRGLKPVIGSADCLPFQDQTFDVVVMLDVFEHLSNDSVGAKEIFRVLRRGGIAIVTVPAFKFLWGVTDELSNHHRRYLKKEVVSLLTKAGLTIQKSTYFNALLFPAIATVRIFVRLFHIKIESENTMGGKLVNRILYLIFNTEISLMEYINFPFGVSVLNVSVKK